MAAPPSKRARTASTNASTTSTQAPKRREPLFAPFRSLGHVSTSTPLIVQSRASKHLTKPALTVLTSLGKSWAMWTGDNLRLLFVGPDTGKEIESLAVHNESTFAASGNRIGRFVRGKQVGEFITRGISPNYEEDSDSSGSSSSSEEEEEDDEKSEEEEVLSEMVLFGNTLVALSKEKRRMYVWDIPPYSNPASKDPLLAEADAKMEEEDESSDEENDGQVTPYAVLEFPTGFTPTKVVHPASYLNKVVVASKEGDLAVWNIRTGSCIHTFSLSTILPTSSSSSLNSSTAITALAQSPAIDVLGIGFANGSCVLFDVRMGESLGRVRFDGDGAGEVSCISFRNDDLAQTLAVASTSGHIALFDLNHEMKLMHLVRNAHEGAVGGIEWVVGQPLFMTNGADNSMKQWLLDTPTAAPRLLKQRSGHHAPPHLVRYYGDDGKALLTAGKDHSLRYTSVVRDSRGYELSQGSIARKATRLDVKPSSLKLPLITSLAYSTSRSKDWDDVVTVSNEEARGRSWSVEGKRVGKFTFEATGKVTVSTVTACGNFGLVGSSTGQVVAYNMQSGLKRKVFQVPTNPALPANDIRSRNVTGVAVDALNRVVIVSTLKGVIHFFDFQTMKLLSTLTLTASITSILLQRDNSLLATICDDLVVRVIDIETKRVVRELSGARGQILDLAFSPDSRWIITASQDSIIRTFDVPTGNLVDAFRTKSVATSLSFSPSGDFLATTHVDSVGVYLWANRAQFAEVSLLTFVEEESLEDVALPTVQGLATDSSLSAISAPTRWEDIQPYTTPDQLAQELVTLSLMPRSKWQTLLNLETIKQRNKPKEAPKAPERAPFFLPTLPGTDARFDFGADVNGKDSEKKDGLTEEGKKRKLDYSLGNSIETDFVRRLLAEKETGTYQSFFEYLKALSPSALDLEIRSLTTLPHLRAFLHALLSRLRSHRDFEATETFLAVFLRIHGDVLISNPEDEIREKMLDIQKEQKKEAERLIDLTHYNLGTLAFLRGVALT
ncbi:rRNA-processing protein UTP21 [Sporobolomyces salmoneus]|uniref:rRNA-processing protein UTP21 n=1 Tax=Sporobolomyces salmoneus TaxID=183962 RepID=UPI00317EA337